MHPLPPQNVAYEALQIGMESLFLKVIERIKTVEMKETGDRRRSESHTAPGPFTRLDGGGG